MSNTILEKTYKYHLFHKNRIDAVSLIQYIPIEGRSFPNEWYKVKKELELINGNYYISSSVNHWPVVQTYATIAKHMKRMVGSSGNFLTLLNKSTLQNNSFRVTIEEREKHYV